MRSASGPGPSQMKGMKFIRSLMKSFSLGNIAASHIVSDELVLLFNWNMVLTE